MAFGYLIIIVFMILVAYTGLMGTSSISDRVKEVTEEAIPANDRIQELKSGIESVNLSMYQHYNSTDMRELDLYEKNVKSFKNQHEDLLAHLKRTLEPLEGSEKTVSQIKILEKSMPKIFVKIEQAMRLYRKTFEGENQLKVLNTQLDDVESAGKSISQRLISLNLANSADQKLMNALAIETMEGLKFVRRASLVQNIDEFNVLLKRYSNWIENYFTLSFKAEIIERNNNRARPVLRGLKDLSSRLLSMMGGQIGYGALRSTYLTSKRTLETSLASNEQELKSLKNKLQNMSEFATEFSSRAADDASASAASATKTILLFSILAALFGIGIAVLITLSFNVGLKRILDGLTTMARGDLSDDLSDYGKDEFGKLQAAAYRLGQSLKEIISGIQDQSHVLMDAAEKTNSVTFQTLESVTSQKQETEMVATAMQEMCATIHDVSRMSQETYAQMISVTEKAMSSKDNIEANKELSEDLKIEMSSASQVFQKLDDDIQKINEILLVIDSISQQTNLLALNAAIEAARAGEQGRGFAVVADEVRTLANRSQQSTKEIKSYIDTLLHRSKAAVNAIEQSLSKTEVINLKAEEIHGNISEVVSIMPHVKDLNMQIATAVEEQNQTSDEISRNITRISELAEHTESGARENQNEIYNLVDTSKSLGEMVEKFKLWK